MRFVHPSLLIWGALAALPIILYLVRPRPRAVRVTTLPFFKSLDRAHQESSWLRRLKQWLSLLLTILVIAGAAAALARPIIAPSAEALQTIVVLVDRSASMQAQTTEGRSRLADGLNRVRAQLLGAAGDPGVIVMAYDRRPEILLSASHDQRAIGRAVDQIVARPIEGDVQRALELASVLAAVEKPAVIWHVTDQPVPDGSGKDQLVSLPAGVQLEAIRVGSAQTANAGITALELRRAPQSRSEIDAFVQVEAALDAPRDAELEVVLDGTLIELRKLTLRPNSPERMLLPLKAAADREAALAVSIKLPGDSLAVDNTAFARVPPATALKVLWLTSRRDPFTETALGSLGAGYDVLIGSPKDWPPAQPVDVAIFDGWLPKTWPTNLPAIVIHPPSSLGPVRVVPLAKDAAVSTRIRATDPRHPILYGVANDRVIVSQTAVVDAESLEPLWLSSTLEPVLLAGQHRGQSLVVMNFEPGTSESFPLLPSFPLLLGNAINWSVAVSLDAHEGRNHRTGDLVELKHGDMVEWTDPVESKMQLPAARVEVSGPWYELNRTGSWNAASGTSGTASLLSASETRLSTVSADAAPSDEPSHAWHLPAGDFSVPLTWGLLVLLLLESWLFHRRAVY